MDFRVAVLGAGYFAQFHLEAWARIEGARLVAVCDTDRARAQAAGVAAFTDFDAMLANGADIVDIATPPPTHAGAVRAALAATPRAVICQKPFATSLAEAEALAQEADTAGVPLIIHENFRFQPWYRAIKAEIDAGALGDILNLTFRMRTGDGQGPNAYLDRQPYFQSMPRLLIHETGVHWIDVFTYLLGAPSGVYADLRRLNPVIAGEDAGVMMLDYASGARAMFDGNRLLDLGSDTPRLTFGEALVEGSDATLALRTSGAVERRAFGSGTWDTILPARDWPGFAGDCVAALQSHVVEALNGTRAFENLAQDYLNVRRIEEAAYRASETGSRIAL